MDRKICKTRTLGATASKMFALLLIICLVECASGSCLSYGHSCWGAHGKRSGKLPATAPNWYLNRLLRRMAANAELNRAKELTTKNDDINAIYELDLGDDAPVTNKISVNDNVPVKVPLNRNPEAKPMLDDDLLSKIKIWQIMRQTSEDK